MKELVGERQGLLLNEFFKSILRRTRYLELLKQENQPGSEDRIENLQELVTAATEAEEQGVTLAEFLDHASLVSDADSYDEHSRVTLMTLHSAKGLEFETVFLVGMEEGLFPHQFSIDDPAGIEEERRLCYVGMTRAKGRLTLSWARQRRSFARESYEETKPSRFLREVPRELLEPCSSAGLSWKRRAVSREPREACGPSSLRSRLPRPLPLANWVEGAARHLRCRNYPRRGKRR
jgi:DNA helicase-2/ATP-dependent DNA helicase PcrA